MNDIKSYREKELKMYIIACIFVLICITQDFSLDKAEVDLIINISKVLNTVLASSSIFIFVFISDSLFSSDIKQKIVTLFGIIKMPGNVIFDQIKDKCKDDRFTKEEVMIVYKNIYDDMPSDKKESNKYQNSKWYKIYSKHRDVSIVFISNRDYLLCRDMVFATIMLSFLYLIGTALDLFDFSITYLGFLGIMIVINIYATHLKARRFAYNVIAYDISHQ